MSVGRIVNISLIIVCWFLFSQMNSKEAQDYSEWIIVVNPVLNRIVKNKWALLMFLRRQFIWFSSYISRQTLFPCLFHRLLLLWLLHNCTWTVPIARLLLCFFDVPAFFITLCLWEQRLFFLTLCRSYTWDSTWNMVGITKGLWFS